VHLVDLLVRKWNIFGAIGAFLVTHDMSPTWEMLWPGVGVAVSGIQGLGDCRRFRVLGWGAQRVKHSLSGEQWRPAWSNMTLESRISSPRIRGYTIYSQHCEAKAKSFPHSHTKGGHWSAESWCWALGSGWEETGPLVQRPKVELAALPLFKCSPFYCQVRTGPDRVDICQRCNCPWDPHSDSRSRSHSLAVVVFLCPPPLFDSASHVENFNLSM